MASSADCRSRSTTPCQNDIDIPLLNRALRGAYPPGSTVKPLYALAAQKYGILSPLQTEYCRGFFILPGSSHQYRDDKKHGSLNMRQAIARSCDVYFYRVAERMGIDRMARFHECFRLRRIDRHRYSGRKAGLYASPEWKRHAFKRSADQVWFPGETISMGIGQGPITVTPLQQAHFAAEIAERGQIIATPRLVTAIRAAGSDVITQRNPALMKPIDIATDEQWDVVYRRHGGSGVARAAPPMRPASAPSISLPARPAPLRCSPSNKPKIPAPRSCDERKRDHAWFIAYAPADDPKIAISVLVENGGFGASAAAPIARKVLDSYLLGVDGAPEPKSPKL